MSADRLAPAGRFDPAGATAAALLALVAGAVLWDAGEVQGASVYGLGPQAMPLLVASGLALLAAANLVMAMRSGPVAREVPDLRAILLIVGGLAALIAVIGLGGGFIPATAILFAATAAAFGRRGIVLDLAIGLALGIGIHLLFGRLLTLPLPAGPIERLL